MSSAIRRASAVSFTAGLISSSMIGPPRVQTPSTGAKAALGVITGVASGAEADFEAWNTIAGSESYEVVDDSLDWRPVGWMDVLSCSQSHQARIADSWPGC